MRQFAADVIMIQFYFLIFNYEKGYEIIKDSYKFLNTQRIKTAFHFLKGCFLLFEKFLFFFDFYIQQAFKLVFIKRNFNCLAEPVGKIDCV